MKRSLSRMKRALAPEKKIKPSAMADIGRIAEEDIPPQEESSLDMVRVACYVHQIDSAIARAQHGREKGD